MKLGLFEHGWWLGASNALSNDSISLPVATHTDGNAYSANLEERIANGQEIVHRLQNNPVDLIIDNGGTGLNFLRGPNGPEDIKLAHEAAGKTLVSHFIDPMVTAFQGMHWGVVWQCLNSRNWIKAVWDKSQVTELLRFGVPNVIHLPMAAPDRVYDNSPLDPSKIKPIVSFVGGQNTSFFTQLGSIPTNQLFAGTLTGAVRSDIPDTSFYDVYFDGYGLGEPLKPTDSFETQIQKTQAYYNAKLYYNAALCIKNRDRFVIFLKRKLGDTFQLIGKGWDRAYGLQTLPPIDTTDGYFQHFRESAININLINGNAETGINMRHFEITAAGGFMMCYHQPELEDFFTPDKECVVFRNEQELIEKINYYLVHPDERIEIALAGQKRTLSQNLYSHRLQTIIQTMTPKQIPVEYSSTNWHEDFKKHVPEPDVVLDCGANIGQFAEGLRNIYPRAEIYSFEPVKSCYEKLQKKCESIGVRTVHKAVSDQDGSTKINLTTSPECNSLLGYEEGNPCAKWTWVVDQETVETCTLDRWCEDNNIDTKRVDIIKLDIQGAELKALHGARKVLKTAQAVYAEVSFVPLYKDSPLFGDIESFMQECGFTRAAIYPSDQPHNWGDALYIKS